MTPTDKRRAGFEAFLKTTRTPEFRLSGKYYADTHQNFAFVVWCAALDAQQSTPNPIHAMIDDAIARGAGFAKVSSDGFQHIPIDDVIADHSAGAGEEVGEPVAIVQDTFFDEETWSGSVIFTPRRMPILSPLYSADQLRAAEAKGLREAAEICERASVEFGSNYNGSPDKCLAEIKAKLEALK